MATGDATDIRSRLRSVLPQGWFPEPGDTIGTASSPTPVLDAILSGIAETLSWIYSLLGYAKNQTRISTSTDGWLEIAALDYFGPGQFPRVPGETDASYAARIQAALLPKANTRQVIHDALVSLTGNPVRMIEPFDPRDTFVWGKSFWGVNTKTNPGQWSNGGMNAQSGDGGFASRYGGLVVCTLPPNSGFGSKFLGWGNLFWGNAPVLNVLSSWWSQGSASQANIAAVYALINKLRVMGTRVYVRFTSTISELQ